MNYHVKGTRFGGHGSFGVRGPMTDDEIRKAAPSVFAEEAHESRSERFAYIPTFQVLAGLRKNGFEVVNAIQGRSRIPGKAEFTKHMLRLRHPDFADKQALGGVAPEAVLVNAHDGTSSYHCMSGVFRSICTNSMIVMEEGSTSIRVPHKGDIINRVIEGSFTVISESTNTLEIVEEWQATELKTDERLALAAAAHTLRFADSEGNMTTPIVAEQLLQARRREDTGNSLWQTYNLLQENVIKGGLRGWSKDANGKTRRATMRPVQNIDGDVKLNRALWVLSAKMAELKSGIKIAA